jgi:hypothetical protein
MGILLAKAEDEVFLNIPYDKKFERLFRGYICGISAFGLIPRATLEIPGGARRLDRILRLIRSCRYAIHDLSRVELDRTPPPTPRFNMPFELGLSVAQEKTLKRQTQEWFVCESKPFRLAKSLSDLNGTDPYIHGGTVNGLFAQLRNMFVRNDRQASMEQMWTIYREVFRSIPAILHDAGSLYSARAFQDLCVLASSSADRVVT